jgi:hypothetical protein
MKTPQLIGQQEASGEENSSDEVSSADASVTTSLNVVH